jgi:trk system potassium uptake protein TrkH
MDPFEARYYERPMRPRAWDPRVFVPARLRPWFRWLLAWRRMSPPALFLLSFAVLIAIGTLGLMVLPGLQVGPRLGFVDALFTMTSAVCVTGLIVVDTATHFTGLGQAWLLLFIQLGGIGLITLTTLLIGALGHRLSLRSEALTLAPARREDRLEIWELALRVTRFSLIVEGAGALALFAIWVFRFPPGEALWHAVFQSISAYCNAGFSTFSDSLVGFAESPLTILVISVLVILGGLGYLALSELSRWWRTARRQRSGVRIRMRWKYRLSSHTWSVIVTTSILLLGGWLLFAVFEWTNTLGSMSVLDKLTNAWFMSVTPRTAGFNTVDYAAVRNDSAALTMMLMFVGGSPGSTAGGIKTTTLAVLVALGMSRMRGHRFVGLKDRAIPQGTIERTMGIILLALLVLVVSFFTLSAIQSVGHTAAASRQEFLPIAFETVSAFSTVGLSMGETGALRAPSELVVIGLMFIGRVGLIAFFTAVVLRRSPPAYLRPAQEDLLVG